MSTKATVRHSDLKVHVYLLKCRLTVIRMEKVLDCWSCADPSEPIRDSGDSLQNRPNNLLFLNDIQQGCAARVNSTF